MDRSQKKTLVIGGSVKPERFSNKAIRLLRAYGHPVVSVGLREGTVEDVDIQTGEPGFDELDTVAMYVGPARQSVLIDYILSLDPKRIIFNPGTENSELESKARSQGIEVMQHCTLVMLNEGIF